MTGEYKLDADLAPLEGRSGVSDAGQVEQRRQNVHHGREGRCDQALSLLERRIADDGRASDASLSDLFDQRKASEDHGRCARSEDALTQALNILDGAVAA